ncbi:MAG: type II toxin-antitoxin system HicB family antitoxin [Chloroflexi bacterium]|nr:type II toxin-antitoxin system HicB family antitoxin [Chloroflexota bacterium]
MAQRREYTVVVHSAEEGGYWAEVPSLSGCFTQGETLEETLASAKEAIESHLEALRREGQAVPKEDVVVVGKVGVAA